MKKILSVLVIMIMTIACLTACGGSGGSSDSGNAPDIPSVPGEEQTWGNITVLVPEGMKLQGGNLGDDQDKNSLWLLPEEGGLNYYIIVVEESDAIDNNIESTREINKSYDVKDIEPFSTGVMEWTGITYEVQGYVCSMLKGTGNGGKCLQVQISGYSPTEDQTVAVCASIAAKGIGENE